MKRLFVALLLLGLPVAALAQNQDEITYFDRAKKKEEVHRGIIQQDSLTGLVCRVGTTANTVTLPAADIIDVRYGFRPAVRSVYDRARFADTKIDESETAEDRLKNYDDALKRYQDLLKEKDIIDSTSAMRHIQYRIARLNVKLAEDDPAKGDAAIAALDKFVKEHPDCWQFSGAVRLLGQMQEDRGDLAAAQKTYDLMASRLEAPRELRLEFQMESVRNLVSTKQYPAAEKMLTQVATTLPKDDPLLLRVQVYQAECQAAANKFVEARAKLDKVLAMEEADNITKGLAHNVLGDCLRGTGKMEEAFWSYLWVDVVYNDSRQEQARALYQLSKLFEQVKKDSNRAQQCRERLLSKEFAGTDYQRIAAREK